MADSDNAAQRGAVYFDDGDVVLSVKDEEKHTVLYRVDTKFLSRHSPVFAGMFSLPPSPGVNEEYDGVPVVRLTDDQKALQDLLLFIYNPASLRLKKRSSNTAPRCMGLLELAQKYEIGAVKSFVAQHLKNEWPTTLDEWRCQQAEIARLEEIHCNVCNELHGTYGPYLSDLFPEPASVIKLCLTYDIPEPLPAALYQLSITKLEDDYDRWSSDTRGKTWRYNQYPERKALSPLLFWRRTARWSLLDADTLMKVFIARDSLRGYEEHLKALLSQADNCDAPEDCEDCAELLEDIADKDYVDKHDEPLGFFEVIAQMVANLNSHDLCDPCREKNTRAVEKAMHTIWRKLRIIFSLSQGKMP